MAGEAEMAQFKGYGGNLEEYVHRRVRAFAKAFAAEVSPHLLEEQVDKIVARLLDQHDGTALSDEPPSSPAQRFLVFTHDCQAIGCPDYECTLCQFNPQRACERNFQKKYLVNDVLKSKCGSHIKLELHDAAGQLITDHPPMMLQVNILDGIQFKDRGGGRMDLSLDELKSCILWHNTKSLRANKGPGQGEALLQYKTGTTSGAVQVRLTNGQAILPDLEVTDSSEALLKGRRPPFRVLVWPANLATGGTSSGGGSSAEAGSAGEVLLPQGGAAAVEAAGGRAGVFLYAVSDEFVVATRRVKQARKVEVPLVDDNVGKIENIGRETVKKLADLYAAAAESGLSLQLDERLRKVETVGQFQALVREADSDSRLRQALQCILKLSKEKWEEAGQHAMTAVVPDFRRRVWYPPGQNMGVGIVFNCKYGAVQLKESVCTAQTSADGSVKVVSEDQLDPASMDILRELKATAVKRWFEPHHPGWGVFREPGESLDAAVKAAAAARGRSTYGAPLPPPPTWEEAVHPPPAPGVLGAKRTASMAGLGMPMQVAERRGPAAVIGGGYSSAFAPVVDAGSSGGGGMGEGRNSRAGDFRDNGWDRGAPLAADAAAGSGGSGGVIRGVGSGTSGELRSVGPPNGGDRQRQMEGVQEEGEGGYRGEQRGEDRWDSTAAAAAAVASAAATLLVRGGISPQAFADIAKTALAAGNKLRGAPPLVDGVAAGHGEEGAGDEEDEVDYRGDAEQYGGGGMRGILGLPTAAAAAAGLHNWGSCSQPYG